jgi:hypothetical protein
LVDKDTLSTEKLVNVITNNDEINIYYLLSLLNSKLISFYLSKAIFSDTTETSRVMDDAYLQKVPVIELSLEKQTPFIEKAETMLSLNKELNEKKQTFFEWLENAYSVSKISKKLSGMEKLSKEDFTKELRKAKVDVDSMKIFNQCMDVYKEVSSIKETIDKTDAEIDRMVYDLYGLTDDEIRIVEESF